MASASSDGSSFGIIFGRGAAGAFDAWIQTGDTWQQATLSTDSVATVGGPCDLTDGMASLDSEFGVLLVGGELRTGGLSSGSCSVSFTAPGEVQLIENTSPLAPMPALRDAMAAGFGNSFFVVGGRDTDGVASGRVYRGTQGQGGPTVDVTPAGGPDARYGASVAVTGTSMVIMGGVVQRGGQEIVTDEVWILDLEVLAWSTSQPLPAPVAFAGAAPLDSGSIIVVGGTDGVTAKNDILQVFLGDGSTLLDPQNFGFEPIRLPRLQSPSVVVLPDVFSQPPADRVFIFGGEDTITEAFCPASFGPGA